MAEKEFEAAMRAMPSDSLSKTGLLVEALRVLDYWSVFQQQLPEESRMPMQDLDIMRWGWNSILEHYYKKVEVAGAFPMLGSTQDTINFVSTLLHSFGKSSLMHRTAEMVRSGIAKIEFTTNEINVKMSKDSMAQFSDTIDIFRMEKMENEIATADNNMKGEWNITDIDELSTVYDKVGAFISRKTKPLQSNYDVEEIEKLMESLVFPWDSGKGIMVGYDAHPQVDDYFFSQAADLVFEWRDEAGIHPEAALVFETGTFPRGEQVSLCGADLALIILFITALHLKHVRFAMIAMKKYPEINISQSLTIWGPYEELVESIATYGNIDKAPVRAALDAITMFPEEASNLNGYSSHFIPLLLNLGNGVVVRPVSSLLRNPFLSSISLLKWRYPSKITNAIHEHREIWMRSHLYAMFYGVRYLTLQSNVKLRIKGQVITDIDGAIFDVTTGELALFQLKWQDYFSNDVRTLRSKTGNLSKELNNWADKVSDWIEQYGSKELLRSLQLKLPKEVSLSNIYLLGISKQVSRVGGYGYDIKKKNLAVSNWAQFRRVRTEIGPADRVFHKIFHKLQEEISEEEDLKPLPVTIKVAGKSVTFENLWNGFEDEDESH